MKSSDQKARRTSRAPSKEKADRSWKRKRASVPSEISVEQEFYTIYGIRESEEGHLRMSPPPRAGRSSATHDKEDTSKKKSDPGNKRASNLIASRQPGEYNNVKIHDGVVGFDLEVWWRRSVASTNFTVLFAMLLLAIAIAHFVAGIVFITRHFSHKTINPYLCDTLECDKASKWLSATMNTSVDPCDNFYEFVCGNYVEPEGEDPTLTRLLYGPNFKIEFGSDSYLAKLLKTYKNDEKKDQAIAYYQRCLDYRKRKVYGIGALKKAFGNVFGTTDLSKFESSSAASNLEEVGSNLFKLMGHGVYLSMAFFAYPYIQIWPPSNWLLRLKTSSPTTPDSVFVHKIMTKIVEEMGTPTNTSLVSELVEGVRVFSDITTILVRNMELYQIDKNNLDKFRQDVLTELQGYCPPLGLSIDMFKVYDKFTGENSSKYVTYFSDTSERFFLGLDICFKENPSKFTPKTTINHPKTAFVGIWVYGIFLEFLQYMDPNILNDWNIGFEGVGYGDEIAIILERPPDYQCLVSMWSTLGYLSSIRFLESQEGKDQHILQETEELIGRLFETTRQKWDTLPETTSIMIMLLGRKLFSRGLQSDLMMPLEGGQLDYSHDILAFTDDHLENTMEAIEYTIQKARQTWMGSTNVIAASKWWGRGSVGPRDLLQDLLSIQFPMINGARFLSENGAAKTDKWVTFLGRKPSNYIRFPMTLVNEPHSEESLALQHAGTTVKIIRSFMSLLSEALYFGDGKYAADIKANLNDSVILKILDIHPEAPQPTEVCVSFGFPHGEYVRAYETQNYGTNVFDFLFHERLYSAVTLKIALSLLREERKAFQNTPPKWPTLSNGKERRLRFQQVLPHRLVDYSEEQLFFLVFVRHVCKGSWKTYEKYRRSRFALESDVLGILMMMKEFAEVWQCPERSFMNVGEFSCLKWTP